ncbi:hypothetical protein B0H14DRAFT_2565212 [Mycena olivaceomarginata]|nr:hypothetical protein B0H14DRAFT_2565212 [Mycena olivaceomarginata]
MRHAPVGNLMATMLRRFWHRSVKKMKSRRGTASCLNGRWDAVGKILALIKQIRMAPQARAFFKKCCTQAGVLVLELLLWVRTQWASLYKRLDGCLILRSLTSMEGNRSLCSPHRRQRRGP